MLSTLNFLNVILKYDFQLNDSLPKNTLNYYYIHNSIVMLYGVISYISVL